MHIRIIHQYFNLPEEGGSLRTFYIARYLKSLGHSVTVITAGNIEGYEKRMHEGMEIHYLPVYYTNHLSFRSRIHAFWLFIYKCIRLTGQLKSPDFNYVLTTPLTTGLIALYEKIVRKIPYVFEIGDIWPEAPIQLGVIKSSLLKVPARWLEKISYDNAAVLVGLSPEIATYLRHKNPEKPVHTITNLSPVDDFKPSPVKNARLEEEYGVNGRKVISYIGTLGMANHLEYLLTAFAKIPKEDRVSLLIMGGGARAAAIRSMAREMDLANVRFIPPGGQAKVRELLSITDAVYISFGNHPILRSGSPNKFFDGLAAGKLIVVNFSGWLKNLVEETRCGIYTDPLQPESLAEKIRPIFASEELLQRYQQNARQLAENSFSEAVQLPELVKILDEVQ